MTGKALGLTAAVLGVLLGVWAAQERRAPEPTANVNEPLSFRGGSRLLRDGRLEPGQARESAAGALRAMALIPPELRPAPPISVELQLRFEAGVPSVDEIAFDRSLRALLVPSDGAALDTTQWLHELAHARLVGSRPPGVLAARLIGAVEEGVADYFAATIAGRSQLGSHMRQRDLRNPPRIGASEWASLAFDGFDRQRMGWVLAARLYEMDDEAGTLLRDAVACLDGESELDRAADSPAAAVDALLSACPEQGRARIARALQDWLPVQLYSAEIPT
jgi:hypothetical protein